MTPEGRVKAKVKELLNRYRPGVYQHWPVQNGMGKPCLDCNGSAYGMRFDIETKAEGSKLTARQEITKRELELSGSAVFVITGVDDHVFQELDTWLAKQALRSTRECRTFIGDAAEDAAHDGRDVD